MQPYFLLSVAYVCPEAARELAQTSLKNLAETMGERVGETQRGS